MTTHGPTDQPRVAVVVATYQRAALLPRLVASARDQVDVDHEVVVVDNGSRDESRHVLAGLADDVVRVLRCESNAGPAPARNAGWRATTAPWIAFTDDDCAPDPTWLSHLLATAEATGADIVQGRTVPEPPAAGAATWWQRTQRIDGWTNRFETCNLLVRRDLLEQLGGFDEQFEIAMGEDAELGWRAQDLGATTAFAPDAVVAHVTWPRTYRQFLADRDRMARLVQLAAHDRRTDDSFARPWLYTWSHAVVAGGALLAPLALRHPPTRRVAAAGLLAWVGHHARPRPGLPAPLPVRLGRGALMVGALAWETACFVRASIRYRRLVL